MLDSYWEGEQDGRKKGFAEGFLWATVIWMIMTAIIWNVWKWT